MSGSKSTALSQGLLKLLLANVDFAGVGDAGGLLGSVVGGTLAFSLHSADPGVGGLQTTSEVVYTGYLRATVARALASWTFLGNTAELAAALEFAACTGGSAVARWLSVGTDQSGAGVVLYRTELDEEIPISNGTTPSLDVGSVVFTEE